METNSSENSPKRTYTDTENDKLIAEDTKDSSVVVSKAQRSFKKLYFISLAFDILGLLTIIADIAVGVCLENEYVMDNVASILTRFIWVLIMNHVPGTF